MMSKRCVCSRWICTLNELLRTEGQQSTLFLGIIKGLDVKILHYRPSQDLPVKLTEAVNLKVTHLE